MGAGVMLTGVGAAVVVVIATGEGVGAGVASVEAGAFFKLAAPTMTRTRPTKKIMPKQT
jgi:hypothetical protein